MTRVLLHLPTAHGACEYHRVLLPARHLQPDLPPGVELHAGPDPEPGVRYDALLYHGGPAYPAMGLWGGFLRDGRPVVWGLDDDVPAAPPQPHYNAVEMRNQFELGRRVADLVVCSTPGVAAAVGDRPTVVAPNLMDVAAYPTPDPAPRGPGDKLVVAWAGGPTHAADLAVCEPGLRHLLARHPGRVEVVFVGLAPPPGLARDFLHRGVRHLPGVGLAEYPRLLAAVRPHVWLAPLADTRFNRAKSNIRVLDGWCLAAAVVASPVGEYAAVRDGTDGLHAGTPDDWAAALDGLMANDDLRHRLAVAGRRRVEAAFDWHSPGCRRHWHPALAAVLALARKDERKAVAA